VKKRRLKMRCQNFMGPNDSWPDSKVCGTFSNTCYFGYSSKGSLKVIGLIRTGMLGKHWCGFPIIQFKEQTMPKDTLMELRITEEMNRQGLPILAGLMMGDHSQKRP